ncbi:MAG: hypothetical protein KY410_06670 [Proteobacteria bacterium]|nr:hypothetical protein [Pseudomonadota bacterium]
MEISEAQRDVRRVYAGGFPGLLISSLAWLISSSLGTWVSWHAAMLALVVGGPFIFFALEILLRVIDHQAELRRNNPLNSLMLQLVFLLPILLPLVVVAFMHRADWLYPAFMLALGAHFLPFMFLFGMWQFGVLGLLFAGSALVFGMSGAEHFVIAGWYGAIVQLLFALSALSAIRAENQGVPA